MNDNDVRSPDFAAEGASRQDKPANAAGRVDHILSVVAVVCGILTTAVFGAYFVKITIFPEGALPIVACLLVFAWIFIPFAFRRTLRRRLKNLFIPAKAVYAFVLAAFCASYAAFCVFIFAPCEEVSYDALPERAVVVVFGAKINRDGSPGTPLMRRLNKAAEILEARPEAVCIVSGGKGDDEPIAEAEAMKSRLVSAGIDESRIIVESRSRNTLQNVSYSREIIEENGLSDCAVVCVSSDFHIARIRFISQRVGGFGDYFYCAGGLRAWDWEYFGLVREYLSFGRLLLLGVDS